MSEQISALHPHVAYRRGLCTDCQQVAPAAGMPRCWPCHSGFTGIALTPQRRRQAAIRRMVGPVPSPRLFALAAFLEAVTTAAAAITEKAA